MHINGTPLKGIILMMISQVKIQYPCLSEVLVTSIQWVGRVSFVLCEKSASSLSGTQQNKLIINQPPSHICCSFVNSHLRNSFVKDLPSPFLHCTGLISRENVLAQNLFQSPLCCSLWLWVQLFPHHPSPICLPLFFPNNAQGTTFWKLNPTQKIQVSERFFHSSYVLYYGRHM